MCIRNKKYVIANKRKMRVFQTNDVLPPRNKFVAYLFVWKGAYHESWDTLIITSLENYIKQLADLHPIYAILLTPQILHR